MHRGATQVLSLAILVIGVVMVVSTIARGGGPFAIGVVLGLLFCGLGAGRLVLSRHG